MQRIGIDPLLHQRSQHRSGNRGIVPGAGVESRHRDFGGFEIAAGGIDQFPAGRQHLAAIGAGLQDGGLGLDLGLAGGRQFGRRPQRHRRGREQHRIDILGHHPPLSNQRRHQLHIRSQAVGGGGDLDGIELRIRLGQAGDVGRRQAAVIDEAARHLAGERAVRQPRRRGAETNLRRRPRQPLRDRLALRRSIAIELHYLSIGRRGQMLPAAGRQPGTGIDIGLARPETDTIGEIDKEALGAGYRIAIAEAGDHGVGFRDLVHPHPAGERPGGIRLGRRNAVEPARQARPAANAGRLHRTGNRCLGSQHHSGGNHRRHPDRPADQSKLFHGQSSFRNLIKQR